MVSGIYKLKLSINDFRANVKPYLEEEGLLVPDYHQVKESGYKASVVFSMKGDKDLSNALGDVLMGIAKDRRFKNEISNSLHYVKELKDKIIKKDEVSNYSDFDVYYN